MPIPVRIIMEDVCLPLLIIETSLGVLLVHFKGSLKKGYKSDYKFESTENYMYTKNTIHRRCPILSGNCFALLWSKFKLVAFYPFCDFMEPR